VGYELYCQLLENAVRNRKNLPTRTRLEVTLDLPIAAYLPRNYVTAQKLRIEVYRRLARLRRLDRLSDFAQELRDRFGPPPEPAEWLLRLAELRILAARWHIATIHLEGGEGKPTDIVLGYRSARLIKRLAEREAAAAAARTERRAGKHAPRARLRVVDDQSAYYRLTPAELAPEHLYSILKELLRFPA
jgi:transcription-repair coupling factor (superfamily II helicase)